MTRINVVPVEELTDNFILAEYFELPRIFLNVHKLLSKGKEVRDREIPDHYVLGKGHMIFFYHKLHYLYKRHRQLREEGTKRVLSLKVDPAAECIEMISFRHTDYWGDYEPTPEAIQLNRDRLQYRRKYEGGLYAV